MCLGYGTKFKPWQSPNGYEVKHLESCLKDITSQSIVNGSWKMLMTKSSSNAANRKSDNLLPRSRLETPRGTEILRIHGDCDPGIVEVAYNPYCVIAGSIINEHQVIIFAQLPRVERTCSAI